MLLRNAGWATLAGLGCEALQASPALQAIREHANPIGSFVHRRFRRNRIVNSDLGGILTLRYPAFVDTWSTFQMASIGTINRGPLCNRPAR